MSDKKATRRETIKRVTQTGYRQKYMRILALET